MLPSDVDSKFIHSWEGFTNRFIWPGNSGSGPTIGYGIDIGNLDRSKLDLVIGTVFDKPTYTKILSGHGKKGSSASSWCRTCGIVLDKNLVIQASDKLLGIFWNDVTKRFTGIDKAPGCVKTAVLSCAYNRGVWNKNLSELDIDTEAGRWSEVADDLFGMFNNPADKARLGVVWNGLRKRRIAEANLIYSYLKAK